MCQRVLIANDTLIKKSPFVTGVVTSATEKSDS